jgi:hypothetical protein
MICWQQTYQMYTQASEKHYTNQKLKYMSDLMHTSRISKIDQPGEDFCQE